jgi:hypothetical protein
VAEHDCCAAAIFEEKISGLGVFAKRRRERKEI